VRRTEVQHNTADQVREYLQGALDIVHELELDDDLRVPAFQKAVDLLAAKQLLLEQVAPALPNLDAFRGH